MTKFKKHSCSNQNRRLFIYENATSGTPRKRKIRRQRMRWKDEAVTWGKGQKLKPSHWVEKQNLREIIKMGTGSLSLRICSSVTEQIREFNVPRNTGFTSDMFSRRNFPENGGLWPFMASLSALHLPRIICCTVSLYSYRQMQWFLEQPVGRNQNWQNCEPCNQTFLDRPNSIPGLWTKNKENTKKLYVWTSHNAGPVRQQVKSWGSPHDTNFINIIPQLGNGRRTAESRWQRTL
jgi:hypothetical protein